MIETFNFKADFRKGLIPNLVTLFGLILMMPVFITLNWYGYLGSSLIAYSLGWAMDGFDGYIARKHKMASVTGAFLDQFADKIITWGDIIFFWIILSLLIKDTAYPITFFGIAGILIFTVGALLIAGRIFMVINAQRVKKGKSISSVPAGKIKTNIERGAFWLLILSQLYIRHIGLDDVSRGVIYFSIFALFVTIIFASMSLYELASKINFD